MNKIIAVILLVLISPFLILILIITAIDLKCNPIFKQKRTVNGERVFVFFKIRTMRKQAPNLATKNFENPNQFITSWGSFLRRNSIDEILNLLCIINNDMNFIGPRPVIVIEDELLLLRKKHGIVSKPGITGFAQINGRDLLSLEVKIIYEKYYEINKYNLFFNLYIIYKTIIIVVKKIGIKH